MKSKAKIYVIAASLLAVFIVIAIFVKYYGDWLWFQNIGFASVFTTILAAKLLIFIIFSITFAVFATVNIVIARRVGKGSRSMKIIDTEVQSTIIEILFNEKYAKYVWVILVALFSIIVGLSISNSWKTILQFFHATTFGLTDPIFSKDVSFYVFRLPLFQILNGWYLYSIFLVFLAVGISYYNDQSITFRDNRLYIAPRVRIHFSVLGGLFFLGIVIVYRLKLFTMLFSTRGVAYGASYTDVHAQIPAYWILLIASAVLAISLLFIPMMKKWKFVFYVGGSYILLLVILMWIYPTLLQQYVVKPNEVTKEAPFIIDNIKFTQLAYGLNNVKEKDFPVEQNLTYNDILKNKSTIGNIRLWDRRPLIQSYKQLQEIRLYYDFKNVDVDRYKFDKYLQVALAARELPPSQIPVRARTWVNIHLKYTHGYGLVMNPVNEITEEGMPNFLVKDIPPKSKVDLTITRPEIYYGEETDTYAIVRTKTEEFDYPKGDQNVYTTYQGKGGVKISNLLRRIVYAWKFSDIKILLTGYITDQSRIMFHRIIGDRVRTIAPFLSYDSDPYIVVGNDGKLYWIQDAYTTTTMFPYSEQFSNSERGEGLNYIRNSVKVVIDAYNGKVTYYMIDSSDPLIQTYKKIFPGLFQPFDDMPDFLKNHLRYPTDLFTIQTIMYNIYHMTDPQVFYNQEDLWNIPQEIYQDTEQTMFPYYIIMKLPDGISEEFILMLPLTPSKKNNMVAWMCARCDTPNYGQLIVYKLPKEKLIYGPMQIEARINQKPDISSELTLWGQKGSSVIRGNLLVIPIEHSFIYVEPIYLKAEQSQMPELKRVVAAYGDQLEMRNNLDQALSAIFSVENIPQKMMQKALTGVPTTPLSNLAQKALNHYIKAQDYLKQGDWAKYGQELDRLKQILEAMNKK